MSYAQIARRPVVAMRRAPMRSVGAGLGLFTMADYTIWTVGDRTDQLNRFFDAVQSSDADIENNHNPIIAAGATGTRFWTDWQTFLRDYDAFTASVNAAGSTGISGSGDPILVQLRSFVDRYNALDDRFRAISGIAATTTSLDSRSPGFSLPGSSVLGTGGSIGLMLAIGAGVVGLASLAVIVTQARSFSRAVTSNRRRRRFR